MNILNDILERSTEKAIAQATAPQVAPQVDTSATATAPQAATPAAPSATQGTATPAPAPVSQLSTPIAIQSTATPAPMPAVTNPWGYDAAEMEYLTKSGLTPERLERISGDFNPANYGTPQRQWYESTVTKPTIPDERRLRNARIAASIGDALGSIVQMAAVNGGALTKERRYEDSAMGRTAAQEKELRDLYQQQLTRYENGLYDAGMRDVIRGMDRHRQERAELSGALQSKYKMDQDQAQFEATLRQREDEARQRQENLEAEKKAQALRDEATAKYRDRQLGISQQRANAYVESIKNKKGETTGYQIPYTPDQNDTDVQSGLFGEPLKFVNLSTAMANKLVSDALDDAEFLKKYPQYNRVNVLNEPGKSLTAVERQDVLVRYVQERYDRGRTEPEQPFAGESIEARPLTAEQAAEQAAYSLYGSSNHSWPYSEFDMDDELIEE